MYSTTQNVQRKKKNEKRKDKNLYAWRDDNIYRKPKQCWMIFQLSLAHSYFQSYVTLLLLLPWKRFSSCSLLSVAQWLLATFPRFYSWKLILSASFQPFTSFREACKDTWHFARGSLTAHREFDAESTACIEDTDHPHGCRGCCLSAYHVDFSACKPPLQYPGLFSFPSKQHFVAKRQ